MKKFILTETEYEELKDFIAKTSQLIYLLQNSAIDNVSTELANGNEVTLQGLKFAKVSACLILDNCSVVLANDEYYADKLRIGDSFEAIIDYGEDDIEYLSGKLSFTNATDDSIGINNIIGMNLLNGSVGKRIVADNGAIIRITKIEKNLEQNITR